MNKFKLLLFVILVFVIAGMATLHSCNTENKKTIPVKGVSLELARQRKAITDSVEYLVHFNIPSSLREPVTGKNTIRFYLAEVPRSVILDFKSKKENIGKVTVAGKDVKWAYVNEHIELPGKYFRVGQNEVYIEFIAGDMSLNRNPGFMYTLFVPDRARTAFPCFDQPDLKAVFTLSLTIPEGWKACANGAQKETRGEKGSKQILFFPTKPLPTYLFAFAAGEFDIISETRNGQVVRLFHRETDTALLQKNVPEIFRQVFASLDWLEDYTGIPYPFAKYDMVAIPSFQYGGMEHTGATLYRASRLFLPASATREEELDRANLIAHETSHMWFGDLVTMEWFNEVWLKEVFANFMAEKITNPWFPGTDFRLKFLMAHYRQAYAVDRTPGANPIEQELENLENAGTVYGPIIYHKAPIVMRKLENLAGNKAMQTALQLYLKKYAYGNAGWKDLIGILESTTSENLKNWSHVWVEEAGMPEYRVMTEEDGLRIEQSDPSGEGRIWPDIMTVRSGGSSLFLHFYDDSLLFRLKANSAPMLNADGFCYGSVIMNTDSVPEEILNRLYNKRMKLPALNRAAQWIIIYENLLDARFSPTDVLEVMVGAISVETDPLVLNQLLGYTREIYWKFLAGDTREEKEPWLTSVLWEAYENSSGSQRKDIFRTLSSLATNNSNIDRLEGIWKNGGDKGLDLSEQELINLSYELALKDFSKYDEIISTQENRIKNPDRLAAFRFVSPALSPDPETRQSFVEKLKDPVNREHESWVLTALHYLNYPLRQQSQVRNLRTALEMLKEIQQTGDIFFPGNWLDAWLWGHNSTEAAKQVRSFIDSHPAYPENLEQKILQSSDQLFRAVRILEKYSTT